DVVMLPGYFRGTVEQVLHPSSTSGMLVLQGQIRSAHVPPHNARVLMRVRGGLPQGLHVGSRIQCALELRPAVKPLSGAEFNELQYARSMGAMWYASMNTRNSHEAERAHVSGAHTSSIIRPELPQTSSSLGALVNAIRSITTHRIDMLFHPEYRELAKALLLGDDSSLDSETRSSFVTSGTAHVLAVSGMHITAIASLLAVFFAGIPNRFLRLTLIALPVVLFVAVSGGEASTLRAGIVFVILESMRRIGRVPKPLNILAGVALVMIVANPANVQNAGFFLSFAAVVGIHLFYERLVVVSELINRSCNSFAAWLRASIAMSLAVSIVTMPISAFFFSTVSVSAPLSNLVAVPASLLATAGVGLSVVLSMLSTDIGYACASLAEWSMNICITWNSVMAEVPGSNEYHPLAMVAALAVAGAMLSMVYSRSRSGVFWRLFLLGAVCLCTVRWVHGAKPIVETSAAGVRCAVWSESSRHCMCIVKKQPHAPNILIAQTLRRMESSLQALGYDTLTIMLPSSTSKSGMNTRDTTQRMSGSVTITSIDRLMYRPRAKLEGIVTVVIPGL
ncbi:MAG: hypothetical protein RL156_236, partial [Bacteroidota bacterium]